MARPQPTLPEVAAGRPLLKRLLPLYFVVFNGFVGYSLMITIFTPLIVGDDELLGTAASTSERTLLLGVLLSLYPLAQFLGAPILGALSDRYGRRPVLLLSLVASVCCYGLIALALLLGNVPLLMAACLLAGFSEANIAIAQSAIADVAPAAERGRLFGYVYLSSSFAYVIGPLTGGKLADTSLGYPAPFFVVAGLLLLTVAATFLLFRETHPGDAEVELDLRVALRNVGAAFAPSRLRPLYAGNFFLYLAIFGFFRVYPLYLVANYGMGVSRVSEFLAWVAVPVVLANLGLVAAVSKRWGPREMAVRCGTALAICLAVVVIPNPEGALWVTLGACSLALALCLPAMATMISVAAPGSRQGSALGSNQSLQVGAEAVSGVAGGGLGALSTALPLPTMGALALTGVGLLSRRRARLAVEAPAGSDGATPA